MFTYASHLAFHERARKLLVFSPTWGKSTKHLVAAPLRCGELFLLRKLGAHPKNVIVVSSPEELLELDDYDTRLRLIADDVRGAAKEGQRRFASARVDARGTLTDDFIDQLRAIMAHGMAEEGVLSMSFLIGEEAGEIGEYIRKGIFLYEELEKNDDGMDDAAIRKAFNRVMAVRLTLRDKLRGVTWWDPHYFTFYPTESGDVEVLAYGPVRRKTQSETFEGALGIFDIPVEVLQYKNTEAALERAIHRYYREIDVNLAIHGKSYEEEDKVSLIACMFNLTKREVKQWIAKKP